MIEKSIVRINFPSDITKVVVSCAKCDAEMSTTMENLCELANRGNSIQQCEVCGHKYLDSDSNVRDIIRELCLTVNTFKDKNIEHMAQIAFELDIDKQSS